MITITTNTLHTPVIHYTPQSKLLCTFDRVLRGPKPDEAVRGCIAGWTSAAVASRAAAKPIVLEHHCALVGALTNAEGVRERLRCGPAVRAVTISSRFGEARQLQPASNQRVAYVAHLRAAEARAPFATSGTPVGRWHVEHARHFGADHICRRAVERILWFRLVRRFGWVELGQHLDAVDRDGLLLDDATGGWVDGRHVFRQPCKLPRGKPPW